MKFTKLQKRLFWLLVALICIDACVAVFKLINSTKTEQEVQLPSIQEQIDRSYSSEKLTMTISNEKTERITNWQVKEGDNLWKIADTVYGDGCYYPYIIKLNGMEGDVIRIGQNLNIEYFDDDKAEEILNECYDYIIVANRTKQAALLNSRSNGSARNGKVPDMNNVEFLGNYKITGYDPYCSHCCGGKSNGHTAGGTTATVGRTVAAPKGVPMGTVLYIEGYGIYKVEDRGVSNKNLIDIAAKSHSECYTLTTASAAVYIVK